MSGHRKSNQKIGQTPRMIVVGVGNRFEVASIRQGAIFAAQDAVAESRELEVPGRTPGTGHRIRPTADVAGLLQDVQSALCEPSLRERFAERLTVVEKLGRGHRKRVDGRQDIEVAFGDLHAGESRCHGT